MQKPRPAGRFPPSWVDRLNDGIGRLPGPTWGAYGAVLAVLVVGANGVGWLERSIPLASLDFYLSSLALYPVVAVAAIHWLDAEARRALERLARALPISDDDFGQLLYRLTTLPAGATILWTAIGIASGAAYAVLGVEPVLRTRGPAVVTAGIVLAVIGFALLTVLFFHMLRQLRLISRILGRIAHIDVFQLEPLLGFSGVTARTGMVIVGLGYATAAADPSTFILANPTLLMFVTVSVLVGIGAFVLPLVGMHRRIEDEKERLAAEANRDLQAALAELARRARAGDLEDSYALNKHLASLVIQRDVIERIQTWPWRPGALRAFAAAVMLPVIVALVLRALDRLLG